MDINWLINVSHNLHKMWKINPKSNKQNAAATQYSTHGEKVH